LTSGLKTGNTFKVIDS